MTVKQRLLTVIAALLLVAACGTSEQTEEPAETPTATEDAPPAAAADPPTSWEKGGLKVYTLENSPEYQGASLTYQSPTDLSEVDTGAIPFSFNVENYELGAQTANAGENGLANSADGQHIHLILNNGPYSAHYEPSFEKELDPGHYVALAFLSRSYHESVKNPEAAALIQFSVGDADEYEPVDVSAPHMFYSRPKGVYKGDDTKKLMLDWYLFNTTLSPAGNKVRAVINGVEFVFTRWVPYVIEGLPMGEVTIKLELIDKEGQVVPGPFNSVERTVTLEPADG